MRAWVFQSHLRHCRRPPVHIRPALQRLAVVHLVVDLRVHAPDQRVEEQVRNSPQEVSQLAQLGDEYREDTAHTGKQLDCAEQSQQQQQQQQRAGGRISTRGRADNWVY